MRYHALIVGAGPAGTTAARYMAQEGLTVLVIEQQRIPRVKPCGGALTHRALDNLLPKGVESQFQEHPHQWTFQGFGQPPVTLSRDQPYCHIVERQYFDQFLSEAAEKAGATIHDGESVQQIDTQDWGVEVITNQARYQADYLIGADGAYGPTARLMHIPRPRHGAALETEIAPPDSMWEHYAGRVEVHVGAYPWGYAWVIPRNGILNIGVGSFRSHTFPLKQAFYQFVEQIIGPCNVTALAHPLPYRLSFARPSKGRVLLAGDAAGLMDAFSAEGIYSALRSGVMAGSAVVRAVTQNAPLNDYDQQIYREFWPSLKSAIKMGLLFYPLPGFWSRFFVKNQSLLSDYLDVAMGDLPYHVLQHHTEKALLTRRPAVLSGKR